jgi:signal transduction histidine kinase
MEPNNRILLVDDERDIREVLGISLADMGYEVLAAENGASALELFRDASPQVVLTDIKMPGMDGIELLRRIKHENPETEVVMITGHGDMDLAIKSLKYEASDFITKPINVDVLEIALKRVADRVLMRRKLKEYTENLEALVHEKSELQSHLASLGLMIGSISHGIKGLLTGLDGGLYLLDSGLGKGDRGQAAEGLDIVKQIVERIRKMVLDVLFYAKERPLNREVVEIGAFAEEIGRVVAPKISRRGIDFVRDIVPVPGTAEMDTESIHSALINILENAVDACEKDTSGRVQQIVFRVRSFPDQVCFEVQDNGVGMDAATREKIFTLFFSSKGSKGTGFGLFIAHHVVNQHGGSITVKSSPGQGALFRVRIPRILPGPAKTL